MKKYEGGEITLEKTIKKEFKSDLNSIARGKCKSQEQESTLRKVRMLYEPRESVINFFDDYSTIVSQAKHSYFQGGRFNS